MPSFFLFSFLRQGFTLGQAGLAHVALLLPHSAEFWDDRHGPHTNAQPSTSLRIARYLPETKAVFTAAALTPVAEPPPYITTGCSVQLTLHLSSLPQGKFSQAGAFVLTCPSGEMVPGMCLEKMTGSSYNCWVSLWAAVTTCCPAPGSWPGGPGQWHTEIMV